MSGRTGGVPRWDAFLLLFFLYLPDRINGLFRIAPENGRWIRAAVGLQPAIAGGRCPKAESGQAPTYVAHVSRAVGRLSAIGEVRLSPTFSEVSGCGHTFQNHQNQQGNAKRSSEIAASTTVVGSCIPTRPRSANSRKTSPFNSKSSGAQKTGALMFIKKTAAAAPPKNARCCSAVPGISRLPTSAHAGLANDVSASEKTRNFMYYLPYLTHP